MKDPNGNIAHHPVSKLDYYAQPNPTRTAPAPNFISNIFFLTVAMSHYGYLKTVQTYGDLGKQIEEVERHLEFLNGDGSWRGVRSLFFFFFYLQK